MKFLTGVHWEQVQGVIFDVDGTLYKQQKLRRYMILEMFLYYIFRPQRWQEPLIIFEFRRFRETHAKCNFEQSPYKVYELIAKKFNVSISMVNKLVKLWFLNRPMRHLRLCRFTGVSEFINALISADVKVGVFSDYPGEEKLRALGLPEMLCVCSEDPDVNRLKPNPKGLQIITSKLNLPIDRVLFIGDRQDFDGLCAYRAGIPFLLFQKQCAPLSFNSYFKLLKEFQSQKCGRLK